MDKFITEKLRQIHNLEKITKEYHEHNYTEVIDGKVIKHKKPIQLVIGKVKVNVEYNHVAKIHTQLLCDIGEYVTYMAGENDE